MVEAIDAFCYSHALAADYPPLAHLGIEQGLFDNSVRCKP
jgi:hypothetical protein